ncbi:MAG TPA: cytochrome c maturation protein CcmE [Acidimicrobiales bacterium]|nr:cytochrome c maturation protein CcmE [Acidimicrobiales bacterium]
MTGVLVGSTEPPATPRPSRRRRMPRLRYVIVAMVFAGAIAFLVTKMGGSLNYFDTVDQAVAQKATLGSQTFRLEGLVVPGTVQRTAHGVDFVAAGSEHKVDVVNTGNPPQLFQPDIPVVVVGHFSGWTFVSNQIIVDHSANYIEEHPDRVRAPDGSIR